MRERARERINLDGRGQQGQGLVSRNEKLEHCEATVSRRPQTFQSAVGSSPGRSLTEIGNYIPGIVFETEWEVRNEG